MLLLACMLFCRPCNIKLKVSVCVSAITTHVSCSIGIKHTVVAEGMHRGSGFGGADVAHLAVRRELLPPFPLFPLQTTAIF